MATLLQFDIPNCTHHGCLNNHKGECTLDGLLIHTFAQPLAYFQDSKVCQVRKQINLFRTENLIENDHEKI